MKIRLRLKTTLLACFILVAVLPFMVNAFWVVHRLGSNIEEEAAQKNSLLAESVASELDNFLKMPVHHLEQVAKMIDQGIIPAGNVDKVLDLFVRNDDLFNMVEIIDSQGIITKSFPFDGNSTSLDVSNQDFFIRNNKDKKIYWSKVFISLHTGAPTLTLSMPFSLGILLGHIDLSALAEITDKFTLGSGGYAQITDSVGNVIAHPDRQQILERFNAGHLYPIQQGIAGRAGTYQYTLDHIERIASVVISPKNGWIISFSQPLAEIHAPAQAIKVIVFSGLLIAVLVATVIAVICLRLLLTPLTNLVEESKTITSGRYGSRFQGGYYRELEQLANALNTMVDTICLREKALRDEVAVRIKAEQELKNNQERLQAILDHSPALISIKNLVGDFLLVNQKFEILDGPLPEEIIGKNILELYPSDVANNLWENDLTALDQGAPLEAEEVLRHKDGTLHTYFSIKFPLNDENGLVWGVCDISTDVSERKKHEGEKAILEAQLNQSQKMESIGTLAGGIAHDFNNILAAIIGYTELAMGDIDSPDVLQKDLDEVLKGSMRAKELVQQILTFSRRNDQDLRPLRAQLIVKEVLKLLRSSIPATIEIKQNIEPKCEAILADPSQIHQIVMNLCTNAYHAMREFGGVLEVSLQPVQLDPDDLRGENNLQPGNYLQLSVSDSGVGISTDVLKRIFEPYYTTKEKGEGTGLGLAVVHGIITRLHGHVSVDSEPGKGTTFTVYLPTISGLEEMDQQEVLAPLPTGNERILLVDDDVSIVQLTRTILTKLGYKVTGLTNSLDTLLHFKQNPEEFDLVITDMTMPNMTGERLAQQILTIRPGMPIILCTGYSENFDAEKARAMGIGSYIMKPVVKRDLAVAVRKVLDGIT